MKFNYTKHERTLFDCAESMVAPGKHCARNAFFHLEAAWKLRSLDPGMAAFRALTAEEEAAKALFHALQHRRYFGWNKIKLCDHRYKVALLPFLSAVKGLLLTVSKDMSLRPQLGLGRDGKWILRFRVPPHVPGVGQHIATTAPLDLSIMHRGKAYDFSRELDALATRVGKKMENYVRDLAERRNGILYANESGAPLVLDCGPLLKAQRVRVRTIVLVYLLIDQDEKPQSLAQQALLAFLKMMKNLPDGIQF